MKLKNCDNFYNFAIVLFLIINESLISNLIEIESSNILLFIDILFYKFSNFFNRNLQMEHRQLRKRQGVSLKKSQAFNLAKNIEKCF